MRSALSLSLPRLTRRYQIETLSRASRGWIEKCATGTVQEGWRSWLEVNIPSQLIFSLPHKLKVAWHIYNSVLSTNTHCHTPSCSSPSREEPTRLARIWEAGRKPVHCMERTKAVKCNRIAKTQTAQMTFSSHFRVEGFLSPISPRALH